MKKILSAILTAVFLSVFLSCDGVFVEKTTSLSGRVFLSGEDSHQGIAIVFEGTSFSGVTSEDGSFTLSGIPFGKYTISFEPPAGSGFAEGIRKLVDYKIETESIILKDISIPRGSVRKFFSRDGFGIGPIKVTDDLTYIVYYDCLENTLNAVSQTGNPLSFVEDGTLSNESKWQLASALNKTIVQTGEGILWSIDLETGVKRKVYQSKDSDYINSFCISKDSMYVAFSASEHSASAAQPDKRVYLYSLNGTGSSQFVGTMDGAYLQFSHGSQFLYYYNADGLNAVPVGGGDAFVVADTVDFHQSSSDDAFIVYKDGTSLYLVDAKGGIPVFLADKGREDADYFQITGDDVRVVYSSYNSDLEKFELYSLVIDGGTPVRISDSERSSSDYENVYGLPSVKIAENSSGLVFSSDTGRYYYSFNTKAIDNISLQGGKFRFLENLVAYTSDDFFGYLHVYNITSKSEIVFEHLMCDLLLDVRQPIILFSSLGSTGSPQSTLAFVDTSTGQPVILNNDFSEFDSYAVNAPGTVLVYTDIFVYDDENIEKNHIESILTYSP